MRTLLLLGLLIGALPAPALAACECMIRARPNAPPRPLDAPILFAGRVLTIDTLAQSLRVRFVVDSSWRNPLPDTLSVETSGVVLCGSFYAGASYLVGAEGQLNALRLPPCNEGQALTSGAPLPPRLRGLGTATWRAPPAGQRQLDQLAHPIWASPPSIGPGDIPQVSFGADTSARRLEIANLSLTLREGRTEVRLPAGLYQYRVTRSDGTVLQSYVELRCERRLHAGGCSAIRSALGR